LRPNFCVYFCRVLIGLQSIMIHWVTQVLDTQRLAQVQGQLQVLQCAKCHILWGQLVQICHLIMSRNTGHSLLNTQHKTHHKYFHHLGEWVIYLFVYAHCYNVKIQWLLSWVLVKILKSQLLKLLLWPDQGNSLFFCPQLPLNDLQLNCHHLYSKDQKTPFILRHSWVLTLIKHNCAASCLL